MTWKPGIDEAYAPFAGNITAFADLLGAYEDPGKTQRLRATGIKVETPVELDLLSQGGHVMAIGTTPPVYRVETTIMPVFHTLRMTIVPSAEVNSEPGDLSDASEEALR